ncbi:hypothetical protein F4780DRAFT_766138 [Xylariomycetidae sp. FL0641]|nr:hypothetical protein F4780DRAFT_766138 [Xylariomycetidae sp. FL0641]
MLFSKLYLTGFAGTCALAAPLQGVHIKREVIPAWPLYETSEKRSETYPISLYNVNEDNGPLQEKRENVERVTYPTQHTYLLPEDDEPVAVMGDTVKRQGSTYHLRHITAEDVEPVEAKDETYNPLVYVLVEDAPSSEDGE